MFNFSEDLQTTDLWISFFFNFINVIFVHILIMGLKTFLKISYESLKKYFC